MRSSITANAEGIPEPTTDYRFVRTYKEGGPLVEFRGNKPDYSGHSFVPVPVRKGA